MDLDRGSSRFGSRRLILKVPSAVRLTFQSKEAWLASRLPTGIDEGLLKTTVKHSPRPLLLLTFLLMLVGCASDGAVRSSHPERPRLAIRVLPESSPSEFLRTDWMPGNHWDRVPGTNCTTREWVLKEESRWPPTVSDSACGIDSGLWICPFTGDSVRSASRLDIDHMVPLSEAHRSGAASWPPGQKRTFANSLVYPAHLTAVTLGSNRSKGDSDPSEWLPPLPSAQCPYFRDWAEVKARWDLSMDSVEFEVVRDGLDSCAAAGRDAIPFLAPYVGPIL